MEPLAAVDGWPINLPDSSTAVTEIVAAARRRESFAVFTLNLDHIVKLRSDDSFRDAYRAARFVTADGAPVARLAALQDERIERATGADLVVPLVEAAAREDIAVFFFGTAPGVIAEVCSELEVLCNGRLRIAGSISPSQGFDPQGPDADAAIEAIRTSGAGLCFVALGAPKQELFAARAVSKGAEAGFVCVGAALDFIAGAQSRAPVVMQKHGLEWLWRLATNPRRLAMRYLLCALVLADLTLLAPLHALRPGTR